MLRASRYSSCWRLYRTAAGYRLLLPNVTRGIYRDSFVVDPQRFDWQGWGDIPVDAMYRQLCLKQGAWRARLTPKPWRLETGDEAVCELISTPHQYGPNGGSRIPQPYLELVERHDDATATRATTADQGLA